MQQEEDEHQMEEIEKPFSKRFVLTGLAITGVLILYNMRFFLDGFLGAVTLYVLFKPFMHRLLNQKWKKSWAALIIILLTLILVLLPAFFLLYLIIPKISMLFTSGSLTMGAIQAFDFRLYELTGFNILTSENIAKLQSSATGFITGFFGQTINIITDLALLYLFLYYLLINIGKNEVFLEKVIPLSKLKTNEFAKELEDQTRSNALGIPLLALAQGLFAALGYWIFQIPEPLFWGLITGMFSILPMIGSALIWIPAGLYLLSAGNNWQGIGMLLYGAVVIGTIDNVFRLFFQKLFANIHPLITIVGIIVGIQMFGLPGLIFGPLLISYFILFFKIFRENKKGQLQK